MSTKKMDRWAWLAGWLLVCQAGIVGAAAAAVEHPRLLITPERVAVIRRKIQEKHPHYLGAYELMVRHAAKPPDGWVKAGYGPCYRSRSLAFLSLVAPDAAERKRFAQLAAKIVPDAGYIKSRGGSKTLGYAMQTFGVALTYDWAYNEWTPEQRARAEATLAFCKGHWAKNRRVSENNVTEYNFYGVLYGCRTMMWLALGEEKNPRVAKIADILRQHLTQVGGELGAHGEGMGYTEYPAGFSLPAAYALAQHGHPGPLEAAKKHAFWKLNMYARSSMGKWRTYIQYGVGSGASSYEGLSTMAMTMCPQDQLPYYLWHYDRETGQFAKRLSGEYQFDSHRGNTPFSMIFYPDNVKAKDPTGRFPKMVYDSHGFWFLRNRWKDPDDIQVAILGDIKPNAGWNNQEQLNIRLMAFDTMFFGGPGKTKKDSNQSTLLVDGRYNPEGKGHIPGKNIAGDVKPDGGYAIVGSGNLYKSLGVDDVQRHLLVKFSDPKANTAIISTLDDIKSAAEHKYTWQVNLGPGSDKGGRRLEDDGIKSSTGKEAGRPFFLLNGRNGYVKGWVLHPADATIKAGDPLQVDAKGKDAKIWMVMHVAPGKTQAKAAVSGDGMQSVLKVGGQTIRFDGKRIEVK